MKKRMHTLINLYNFFSYKSRFLKKKKKKLMCQIDANLQSYHTHPKNKLIFKNILMSEPV